MHSRLLLSFGLCIHPLSVHALNLRLDSVYFFNLLLFVVSAEKPQPFDFLVDGELIRTSLEQFLLSKGISAVCIIFPEDGCLFFAVTFHFPCVSEIQRIEPILQCMSTPDSVARPNLACFPGVVKLTRSSHIYAGNHSDH